MLPELFNVGKGTSAGHRGGRWESCQTSTKTGPFSIPVKRQSGEVGGAEDDTQHGEQEDTV